MAESLAEVYDEAIHQPVQNVVDVGMAVVEPTINFMHWLSELADLFLQGSNDAGAPSTSAGIKTNHPKTLYGLVDMGR